MILLPEDLDIISELLKEVKKTKKRFMFDKEQVAPTISLYALSTTSELGELREENRKIYCKGK